MKCFRPVGVISSRKPVRNDWFFVIQGMLDFLNEANAILPESAHGHYDVIYDILQSDSFDTGRFLPYNGGRYGGAFMKRNVTNLLRIACLIALFAAALWGVMELNTLHSETTPLFYARDFSIPVVIQALLFVLIFALMPFAQALAGIVSGYRLYRIGILFLVVTRTDKLRIRLSKRLLFGVQMLPPRTDGTSPYKLYLMAVPLYCLSLSAMFLLLAFLLWQTAAAQTLIFFSCVCFGGLLGLLLPQRHDGDRLSQLLSFRRSRDLRRAWECWLHMTAALNQKIPLADMPDEWFQAYPAEMADDLCVSVCMINGSSRLIRQRRFTEAYDMLRPLFDLKPAPETHQTIACALLNGAICEAMEDLPPMCLSQLEHPSVKYMLPHTWQPRLLTAQYARALFIRRDEAEAAALLAEISKIPDEVQIDASLLTLLQEKAAKSGDFQACISLESTAE